MQTRPLGQTGMHVSRLCLGTMTFGEQNSEAEAHAQLDRATAAGINSSTPPKCIPSRPRRKRKDAPRRTSGAVQGTWQARRSDSCDQGSRAGARPHTGGPRLTRDHLHRAVDDSLARLQTDYIDLYQLHWPDRNANFFGKLVISMTRARTPPWPNPSRP